MFDGVLAAAAFLVGVLNLLQINKLKERIEALETSAAHNPAPGGDQPSS